MMLDGSKLAKQTQLVLKELIAAGQVQPGQIVVIGASTSEVIGQHIGTSGTEEVARAIYEGIEQCRKETGFYVAIQCCEHLNRALVVEQELLQHTPLERVSAIPIAHAGGSLAAFAYRQMTNPCLVETIQAHAGIDIGETLIGMHLRKVAVPFRPSIRQLGEARVNMAYTRPKLIGGVRAVYTLNTN